MSITALVWAALYIAAVVITFSNPLFGALGYLLEYYMRPELKWWGDELPALRYNLIVSLALGGSFLLRRSSLREMVDVPNPTARWLCAMAVVMVLVTATVAVDFAISWSWAVQWVKMAIIFPMLVAAVVRSRNAFNLFMVVHMLGAAWWGYETWLDPSREAGRLKSVGSGDSLDDNGAAAHLLTVLPLAVTYLFVERNKRLRAVAIVATPLVINTLILCNSRGSMVGLGVATLAAVLLIRSGRRLRLITAAIATIGVLLLMADEQFISRQQTTTQYEQDSSAQQRLTTWQGALRLVGHYPLGTGGRGFHLLSPIYIPEIVAAHGGDRRAPHNTWVMVASEWGIPGFICFIGIYGSALLTLQRIKKNSTAPQHDFYYWRAFAMQLGLIAFLGAGTFTDRLYAEAGYWLVGLTIALYRIQQTDFAEASVVLGRAAEPAPPAQWPLATAP